MKIPLWVLAFLRKYSHSMEAYKNRNYFMLFHGLAGRRWCGKIILEIQHTVKIKCCIGVHYLQHVVSVGDFPLKPCAGQSGEMEIPGCSPASYQNKTKGRKDGKKKKIFKALTVCRHAIHHWRRGTGERSPACKGGGGRRNLHGQL